MGTTLWSGTTATGVRSAGPRPRHAERSEGFLVPDHDAEIPRAARNDDDSARLSDQPNKRPRRATLPNTRWAIGLDVGGTKLAAGLVDLNTGTVLARRVVPTAPERGGAAVLADALAMAEDLAAAARARGGEARGVGVGVAELVDPSGTVRSANLIAWEGLPVREHFAAIAPAIVESDVRVAALAEARYGAGRRFRIFAYVTVGTGISSCLVQDGRPFAGARGNALVLSTGPLTLPCDVCGSRIRHVLEEYSSGPALVARYGRLTGGALPSAEAVCAAAAAGDAVAIAVVRTAGEALGSSVGFLVNVLDPAAVVVGGGLGLAGGLYWRSFVAATREHVWSEVTRALPIVPAALGVDAGLIGAAAAATAVTSGRFGAEQNLPVGEQPALTA